ncbi:MAG: LysM peptidoglycan-binding domain-containing protein [Betaproteobacteria bacterium]|nr:LysM peptidoglycan-binding domain-containing protein [Betaproteobacteria bacterium]
MRTTTSLFFAFSLASFLCLIVPVAHAVDGTVFPPGAALAPDRPVFTTEVPAAPKPDFLPAPAFMPNLMTPAEIAAPRMLNPAQISEEEASDVWGRIRQGFQMPEIEGPLVEKHKDWYSDRPDYMARMIDRSRRYLFFIVAEIEKRGMPMEIALLPMVESAYNPRADSRMKAAGMWQFIPSTGKRYGLKQNFWYDGRRDVLDATRAALDYLQTLHALFGDWQLALAAYNWGEGAVARAVAKNRTAGKPTDYANLTMPAETRNYLPKLQAVKNLISDPEAFGFTIESVPNQPYFTTVKVPGQIDVKLAAKLANMSVEEFRYLNPAHSRPVILPGAGKQLLVPADKAGVFHENLENFERPLVTWQSHRVQRKERLPNVAQKYDVSVELLREANGLTAKSRLRPGQLLLVPARNPARATALPTHADHADFAPANSVVTPRRKGLYRVKRGETLFAIARKHAVSVAQLKSWNRLKANTVRAGQLLVVGPHRARGQKLAMS